MPELPEVETIRLGLKKRIIGKKIANIEILVPKIFQGNKKEIIGKKVVGIFRRAKILGIEFGNSSSSAQYDGSCRFGISGASSLVTTSLRSTPEISPPRHPSESKTAPRVLVLLFHLKLTGQIVFVKNGTSHTFGHPIPFAGTTLPAKSTAVIFDFSDGSRLFYNDVRKFGWIRVINHKSSIINQLFSEFGIEPFTPEFTEKAFEELIKKYKKPIKLILMDQKMIAGVGNIYANEALFLAKIDPRRPSNALKDAEVGELYKSLINVLEMGIKYQGSSEAAFVNVNGEKGSMQDHFKVYGKTGKSCPDKCGGTIERIVLGGRGTFFCSICQR